MATFNQSSTASQLYIWDETLAAIPYQVAFLSISGGTATTLTLEESWSNQVGVYLFLGTVVAESEHQRLSDRLFQFLTSPSVQYTRFLWLANPLDPIPQWQFYPLTLNPIGQDNGGIGSEPVREPTVRRLTLFDVRNYAVAIARGVTCRLNEDKTGFVFAADSTMHQPPGAESQPGAFAESMTGSIDPFFLSTDYGARRLTGIQQGDNGEAIALPFTGPLAGCLQFALTLYHPLTSTQLSSSSDTQSGLVGNAHPTNAFEQLTALDIALHMSFKDPDATFAGLNTDADFLVTAHRYPFLGEDENTVPHYPTHSDGTQDLTLYVALDVLNPLKGDRTFFSFLPVTSSSDSPTPKIQNPKSKIDLPSCYRTNLGYTLHLAPQSHPLFFSRLIFAEQPIASSSAFDPPLYLTPYGDFVLSVPRYDGNTAAITDVTLPADNFLCGLSGVEYIKLEDDQVHIIAFRSGGAAFLPTFQPKAGDTVDTTASRTDEELSFSDVATTSWAYVRQVDQSGTSQTVTYYAQPDLSILYEASTIDDGNQDARDNLLTFLEVPVSQLPNTETPSEPTAAPTFPLLPYGGVTGTLVNYRQMEQQYVNPKRRSRIFEISGSISTNLGPGPAPSPTPDPGIAGTASLRSLNAPPSTAAFVVAADGSSGGAIATTTATASDITGVTPQGLLATYSSDYATLKFLTLAKDTDQQNFGFNTLAKRNLLREAFQSNQLFLVISDPSTNLAPYFQQDNQLVIQGWVFDLDPDAWRDNTVLIFKFFDRPLSELIEDTTIWSFKDDFNTRSGIKSELVTYFQGVRDKAAATASAKDQESYQHLARILDLENWSGILALNVKVPPNQLPDELLALAAGIDENQFFAQYVMIEDTPVLPTTGGLVAEQSSLFGLIDYSDTSVPAVGASGYAFQVSMLRVRFHNSQVVDFSSEVNLTLDQLFEEGTQLFNSRTGRNIVIFKGSAETHNGKTKYSFSFSGDNYFVLVDSQVLDGVNIIKADFTTDPQPAGSDNTTPITGRFTFWGELNFKPLAAFDALSFGPEQGVDRSLLTQDLVQSQTASLLLERDQQAAEAARLRIQQIEAEFQRITDNEQLLLFSNLLITMTFRRDQPGVEPEFVFDAMQLAFDLKRSQVRAKSLYAKFPITLTNVIRISESSQPSGYLAVTTPLASSGMPTDGYGLVFDLNLGGLGALAGAAKFVAKLLIAWTPNTEVNQTEPQVHVGLQLPGISGDVLGFPLQSVIKLSFKKVQFVVDSASDGYLLKIKNVALKLLTLSFPPNGQTELIVFGNPNSTDKDTVGWYAAYAKEPAALPEGQSGSRASPTRTR